MRAAKCGAHKKAPPHLETRAGDKKVCGNGRTPLGGGEPPDACRHGWTFAGRHLRSKSGHEQPARSPKDEKKELGKSTSAGWATGLCGQHRKKSSARQVEFAMNASTCPAPVVHVLVCSRHFWRDFESAGDASLLLPPTPATLRRSHCS